MKKTHTEFGDFAPRIGSKSIAEQMAYEMKVSAPFKRKMTANKLKEHNLFYKAHPITEKPHTNVGLIVGIVVSTLFILALAGSAIWGNQGFVDLLASFIS